MPAVINDVACNEHRVAAIDPTAWTVLTFAGDDGSRRLPRIQIPIHTRTTQHLHQAIAEKWNLRGVAIDYLRAGPDSSPCGVLEVLPGNSVKALQPVDLHEVTDDLAEQERSAIARILGKQLTNPLLRVGWIDEARDWVEQITGETIRSPFAIQQLNAGGGFALLRFSMQSGRSYWLKATAEPNRHEPRVSSYLSKLCPGYVPEVLGFRADWNAWITLETRNGSGVFPTQPANRLQLLSRAITTLAEIQRRTLGQEAALLSCGAFDQRLDVLAKDADALFEKIAEAMSLQTSTKAPRIEEAQLRTLREAFEFACEYLQTFKIPSTILHGDMNPGNVLWGETGCQFIDWSEAYVGHPLVTLQHLLLLNNSDDETLKSNWDRTLIERYRAAMSRSIEPLALDRALICMPLIAAASALYGRGAWLRLPFGESLYRQTRIRTLARHMDRASRDPAFVRLLKSHSVSTGQERQVATCSY